MFFHNKLTQLEITIMENFLKSKLKEVINSLNFNKGNDCVVKE
jgi:hypothetical protein